MKRKASILEVIDLTGPETDLPQASPWLYRLGNRARLYWFVQVNNNNNNNNNNNYYYS